MSEREPIDLNAVRDQMKTGPIEIQGDQEWTELDRKATEWIQHLSHEELQQQFDVLNSKTTETRSREESARFHVLRDKLRELDPNSKKLPSLESVRRAMRDQT